MKYLLLSIILILSQKASAQTENDSTDLRVYNAGKHKIINMIVTVNAIEYTFSDIKKWQHSEYKTIPYIYSVGNKIEVTLEHKRFLRKNDIVTIIQYPIDHISDEKHTTGKCVMAIRSKVSKKNSMINQEVIFETAN